VGTTRFSSASRLVATRATIRCHGDSSIRESLSKCVQSIKIDVSVGNIHYCDYGSHCGCYTSMQR
jgi:hypothetical protein